MADVDSSDIFETHQDGATSRRVRNRRVDHDAPVVYVTSDNDAEIRAAAPASPRRLVRKLRSPGIDGEDWDVGRLSVKHELTGAEGLAADAFAEGVEETRCAYCCKCSVENRACRGGVWDLWTLCVRRGSNA